MWVDQKARCKVQECGIAFGDAILLWIRRFRGNDIGYFFFPQQTLTTYCVSIGMVRQLLAWGRGRDPGAPGLRAASFYSFSFFIAVSVLFIWVFVWAVERKFASNWDGGR